MNDGAPRAAAWRAVLVGVAAFAGALVVLVLLAKTVLGTNGDAGLSLVPAHRPYTVTVASVTPRGPAARAGVRAGDRIDLRALSLDDRVLLIASPVAGRAVPLRIERGGSVRTVTIVPERTRLDGFGWAAYVMLLWMAAFAAVIGWRRPAVPEARLLSLAMSVYVAADVLQFLATPWPAVDVAVSSLEWSGILGTLSLALFVRFSELFGRPLGTSRRILDGIAYAGSIVLGAYGIIGAFALAAATIDPVPFYFGTGAAALLAGVQLLVVAAGIGAVAGSRGVERQRAAWAVVSFGVLFVATSCELLIDALVPTTDMQVAAQAGVNAVALVTPVGLTYAIVSRRLLDIGFALNRAAVFSTVSLIIVSAFMGVEWALGNWLSNLTQFTSTLVGLAVAIVLGFSIKFIHHRVDHAIDHVFFRRRHEQERALLRFAAEAAYVTDADSLLRRTVAEVQAHSSASSVAILCRAGRRYETACSSGAAPPSVDENDPAVVRMRASKEHVHLHRYASAIDGELAFPMVARGALIGMLVSGDKRDADPYAPDEIAALAGVAHAVGVALDMLLAHHGPDAVAAGEPSAAVLALQVEVAALRDDVRELLAALRLPERS